MVFYEICTARQEGDHICKCTNICSLCKCEMVITIKGCVRHELTAAFTVFCLAFNLKQKNRIFVNVPMHTPNLYPICLQQCPKLNLDLVDQSLHAAQIQHSLSDLHERALLAEVFRPHHQHFCPDVCAAPRELGTAPEAAGTWGKRAERQGRKTRGEKSERLFLRSHAVTLEPATMVFWGEPQPL